MVDIEGNWVGSGYCWRLREDEHWKMCFVIHMILACCIYPLVNIRTNNSGKSQCLMGNFESTINGHFQLGAYCSNWQLWEISEKGLEWIVKIPSLLYLASRWWWLIYRLWYRSTLWYQRVHSSRWTRVAKKGPCGTAAGWNVGWCSTLWPFNVVMENQWTSPFWIGRSS